MFPIVCAALLTATFCSAQLKSANGMPGQGKNGGKPASAGISVSTATTFSAPSFFTTELGRTAEFRVVLDSQPTADVTINLTSNGTTEGYTGSDIETNVQLLIFTPNSWNSPQTVIVTGVQDQDFDPDALYSISTVAYSVDENYNNREAADVWLSNIDDDSPVINAVYVYDFAMERRKKGPSTEVRLLVDVRHDTDADGVPDPDDSPAADAVVVISIYDSNGMIVQNIVGTVGAQGTGTTYWYKLPGTGVYHIEVHDVSLDGFYWDPLEALESSLDDADADGRPDLQLFI